MKARIEELHNRAATDYMLSGDPHAIRHALNTVFNEALELAARECDSRVQTLHSQGMTPAACAAAIRKLKVE